MNKESFPKYNDGSTSTRLAGKIAILVSLLLAGPELRAADVPQDPRISAADDGGGAHVMFTPDFYREFRGSLENVKYPTAKASPNDLTYHGGSVMRNVVNYVIIWNPPGSTFSANYQKYIEQYFTDCGNTPFMMINSQYGETLALSSRQIAGLAERGWTPAMPILTPAR